MGKWFASPIGAGARLRAPANPRLGVTSHAALDPALRSAKRWAALLVGLPLAPVLLLSQRGLTHEATCTADSATPFSVMAVANDDPIVSSAMVLDRDAPIPKSCEGLEFAPQISPRGPGQVLVLLPITNSTTSTWRASILLTVNSDTTTVALGPIKSGGTTIERVLVHVSEIETTITARLIVGP